jgi:anion-transporting  ArsA/GET3 family ATPase
VTAPAAAVGESLAARKILLVTGKGGVGKTAVAAALGRALARRGRRTLVFEVDPRESLHQMLGTEPSGGAVIPVETGLWLQNLKPGQVMAEIVRERLRLEALARRVLDSPIYQHFAQGAPGLKEVATLGHALRLLRGRDRRAPEALDVVVLDAPATGHGLSLLEAPRLLSEVIRKGPFGEMGAELAAFVDDPVLTGVVVVTTAEEMPVQESLELREALAARLHREPELLVLNALYPPLPPALLTATDPDPALSLWRHRRGLNDHERARLLRSWPGPRIEVPLFALEQGPALVAALTTRLEAGL